jgi:predicted secreted protein
MEESGVADNRERLVFHARMKYPRSLIDSRTHAKTSLNRIHRRNAAQRVATYVASNDLIAVSSLKRQGGFRAFLDALGVAFASVTDNRFMSRRMQSHGTVLTSFNTPTAPITVRLINVDNAHLFGLSQSVFGTSSHARGIFAKATHQSHVI